MTNNLLKTNYNINSGHSSNEKKVLLLNPSSPINRTFFNSSDTSSLSTKLNSSESLLFQSFYINKNIRKFQKRNIKLKNKLLSSSKELQNYSYKNLIKSKISKNLSKLNLPQLNNASENISTKELRSIDFHKNILRRCLLFSRLNKLISRWSFYLPNKMTEK